ncbi:hypothetical protein BVY03_03595, partial [bacterium K02(2017)]
MTDNILKEQLTEIDLRLGETYNLNGHFSSLWALEVVLHTIRKKPEWKQHCEWIPNYLLNLINNAYTEMGIETDIIDKTTLKIIDTNYTINFKNDFSKLLDPTTHYPILNKETWQNSPIIQQAICPWFGFSALLQSTQWHVEQNPDQFNKAITWLVNDYIQSELNKQEELHPLAQQMIKIMLWPPLLQGDKEKPSTNIENLQELYLAQESTDKFINITLKLLTSQDRLLSVMAGALCFLINIAPTSAIEARCLKRCINFFGSVPKSLSGESPERILEVIKILASSNEQPVKISDDPQYLECIKLTNQNKLDEATDIISNLIKKNPKSPLYIRTRGKLYDKQGKDLLAIEDYNKTIGLKADYWQALINRGSYYAKQQKFKLAEIDYRQALKIRPDCENTRDNLLSIYFFNLQKT